MTIVLMKSQALLSRYPSQQIKRCRFARSSPTEDRLRPLNHAQSWPSNPSRLQTRDVRGRIIEKIRLPPMNIFRQILAEKGWSKTKIKEAVRAPLAFQT